MDYERRRSGLCEQMPEGKPLAVSRAKGRLKFAVPRLEMHQMIVLED